MAHRWLQDPEVYFDLFKLEKKLGVGPYLTTEEDSIRFAAELERLEANAQSSISSTLSSRINE